MRNAMITPAKNKKNRLISAKELARTFGISYQTVNYYTDFGLFPVPIKKGNVRFYDKPLIAKRLKEIKNLANEGYSLRLIRRKLIGI